MINLELIIFSFLLSFMAAYFLTPLMGRVATKNKIMSKPSKRGVHTKPIPYLGGVAIYFSFMLGILVIFSVDGDFRTNFSGPLAGLLSAATLTMFLGIWDDIKNIKPVIKLVSQIIIALILFAFGFRIEVLTNPFVGGEMPVPWLFSMLFTIIWFVGLMNAMNLVDGLDGLAAGIATIACGSLIFVSLYLHNYINVYIFTVLAASCLGFLRYNLHPAKIFMGDTGSMFLGMILAAAALTESQHKSAAAVVLLIPATALAIPIYDTLISIVRRAVRRKPIFKADKMHLHHRLLDIGLGQKQIVLIIYLITLYLGIFSFLFVVIPERYSVVLLVLLGLGAFMGVRVIGFVEWKVRQVQRIKRRAP